MMPDYNVVFTNMCNLDINPIELLDEASIFCSILFHQHMFIVFCNIGRLNYIIFSKTKLILKKNVT